MDIPDVEEGNPYEEATVKYIIVNKFPELEIACAHIMNN